MLIIENPPLDTFRIDFKFEKPKDISFEMMAKVGEILKNSFPNVPSLKIIEYPFDGHIEIESPIQFGPIKFQNQDKSGQIQLFSNGLIFIFTKYSRWEDIKKELTEILFKTCDILKVNSIEQFRIEYVDKFQLSQENFNLSDYFTLNINKQKDWEIDYKDFHLGIKILSTENDKFIIRLRGLPPKNEEDFLFRLEILYLKVDQFLLDNKEALINELDRIHDYIEGYFKNIMSAKLKNIIGVREE